MEHHIDPDAIDFNFYKRFLFGGVSGILAKTCIAPIE